MSRSKAVTGATLAAPTLLYMTIFFVAPTLILFVYSFWTNVFYRNVPDFVSTNYVNSLTSAVFLKVTLNAIIIGLWTAAVTVALSVPFSYYITYKTRSQAYL